ncbi:glycosyltransferase [Sutcliffiella horikoshii]|uniref:CgeB family protein n=1 Tax=Sutcliffiella horikoshii TaxID=79883 RepID=UPI00384B96CC
MTDTVLKIVFIGRYTEGRTGIVKSIYLGLEEHGHELLEINLSQRPSLIYNPHKNFGGHGPVYVKWELIKEEIIAFEPDVILFCAGGLTFEKPVLDELKKYCSIIGFTLSDPDVFPTVQSFVGEFDHHTTNSPLAIEMYKNAGIHNTHYMPFAIDSRFFTPHRPIFKYKSDVSIIGHFRPNRLETAKALQENFRCKIFGRGWPIPSMGPVYDDEWFKAMYSTKMVVNFPLTGAGYTNVKVGIFEAAATGRLIFTEYFEEMEHFFEYGKEIIAYSDQADLMKKIRYFLQHTDEAEAIGLAGQKKCADNHTWKHRLETFFKEVRLKTPEKKWPPI